MSRRRRMTAIVKADVPSKSGINPQKRGRKITEKNKKQLIVKKTGNPRSIPEDGLGAVEPSIEVIPCENVRKQQIN